MNSVEKNAFILERSSPEAMGAEDVIRDTPARPARLGRLALIAAILVVLGVIAGYIPRAHQQAALVSETRELAIPSVTVASPVLEKPEATLAVPGEIRAFMDSPIYSRADGYLKRWLVDLGAEVK